MENEVKERCGEIQKSEEVKKTVTKHWAKEQVRQTQTTANSVTLAKDTLSQH